MATKEVTIERSWIEKYPNDISFMSEAMRQLRAAGVPVIGALAFKGVEHGRLIITTDMFDNVVITWEYDE